MCAEPVWFWSLTSPQHHADAHHLLASLLPLPHAGDPLDDYHDHGVPNCVSGTDQTATWGISLSWDTDAQEAESPPVLIVTGSSFIAQGITPITASGHAYSEMPALRIVGVDHVELKSVVFARRPTDSVRRQGLVENHGHGGWALMLFLLNRF